jgi:hypothetical protein
MTVIEGPPQAEAAPQAPPELLFPEAHKRRRRRRLTVSLVGLVLVAAIGSALLIDPGGQPPARGPSLASAPPRFTPPTTSHGDRTTMLIRIPDGRGYALSYASSIGLSHFVLTVSGQVVWPRRSGAMSCCTKTVTPVYSPISRLFFGRPIAVYRGAGGRSVPFYRGVQAAFPWTAPNQDYLGFSFGRWSVLVSDPVHSGPFEARMTAAERMTWASAFDAHISKGGYLVLAPRPPLRVLRGDVDVILHGGAVGLVEFGAPCGLTPSNPQPIPAGLPWCDPKSLVQTSVTGQPTFVALAARSLTIQSLVPIR